MNTYYVPSSMTHTHYNNSHIQMRKQAHRQAVSVALLRARGHVRDNHPNAPFTSQMSARSPGRGMSGAQTPGALGYFQAFQPPPSGVSDSSNPLPSSAPSNHSKHCWGLDGLPGSHQGLQTASCPHKGGHKIVLVYG